MLQIEKAKAEDTEAIIVIFRQCTKILLDANIDQWDGTYPTTEIFHRDINLGHVFVIKGGEKNSSNNHFKWSAR